MTWAKHCDGPDCGTWETPDGVEFEGRTKTSPDTWWTAASGEDDIERHFCCGDCALKYFAKFEPTTVIQMGDMT